LTAGSFQTVWGTSLATRVNGATQFVWGVDFNAIVLTGGAQNVGAGGVANNAIIDGGSDQLVWGVANGSSVGVGGDQKIYAGGAANRATVYGTQYDWGTATDTDLAGGVQYVYGMASGTTVRAYFPAGGIQHVASGGSASNTTIHESGSQYVYGGGTANGTSLYGGYQFVSGSADQITIHSGRQDVYGNVTNTTTDTSGAGQQNIYAGGTATNTTLGVGYYQTNWGTASNTTLNGGIQNVYGTATNTTINSATSVQYVEAGALASNTTIGSGGTENILAGGSAAGVTFAGAHAHLILVHASGLTGAISGWQGTDTIDLGDIAFGSQTTLGYAANANHTGGVLTVSDGSHVATLSLLGQYAATSFALSSDGYGGSLITNPAAAGQVQNVLASPLQV
jgi:autotransporter passenger strand-loop-strand repeat protein